MQLRPTGAKTPAPLASPEPSTAKLSAEDSARPQIADDLARASRPLIFPAEHSIVLQRKSFSGLLAVFAKAVNDDRQASAKSWPTLAHFPDSPYTLTVGPKMIMTGLAKVEMSS